MSDVEYISVTSRKLEALAFDGRGYIYARFPGGAEWRYYPCTRAEFEAVLNADSVGSSFYHTIQKMKSGEKLA